MGGGVRKPRLTQKQTTLVAELKSLMHGLYLNPDELAILEDSSERTTRLELAKRQIISSTVVLEYLLMDEYLNCVVAWHFFGRERGFPALWKTKRFKVFNYQILEKMYLVQKLDFVKGIYKIPKEIASDLMALNDLRNALAHSFFPENRKRKPEWGKKNIFTIEGFNAFQRDMMKLKDFFMRRFFHTKLRNMWNDEEVTQSDLPATPKEGLVPLIQGTPGEAVKNSRAQLGTVDPPASEK
jgi:hypothetical protein